MKYLPVRAYPKTSIWKSLKKGVLRNFSKFTGKHLGQGLFLNNVTGLRLELLSNL